MRKIFILFTLFCFYSLFSQETSDTIEVNSVVPVVENQGYHEYRMMNSVPGYNLPKIKKMISKLSRTPVNEKSGNTMEYYEALPDKDFDKLTEKEKFTYIMIHPERISQSQTGIQETVIVSDEDKKIFGYLPAVTDGTSWSDRQKDFLKKNSKTVLASIKESALKDSHIGLNYKRTLLEINSIEAIPFLIDFYTNKDKKDKDILTLLLNLVKNTRYHPFVRSNIYRDLYAGKSEDETSYIEYSPINEEYIIKTASNLYAQSFKKR